MVKHIIPLFILAVWMPGCNQTSQNKESYDLGGIEAEMIPVTMQQEMPPPPPPLKNQEKNKKKIIRDGRLRVKVDALEDAKAEIDSFVEFNNGYYARENYNTTDREASYDLEIRIPNQNFDSFIASVEYGRGEVLFKEITARDVTDQFIDLETRLKNKRSYLTRYNQLLKKANTVKEILQIEEEIRGLEEEIESTTGRLKYLSDQVDYSTIHLGLIKPKDYKFNPGERDQFIERLKQALSKGWYGFVDFVVLLINLWPLWIIAALVVVLWRRWKKRRTLRNK